jgi:predicted HTH transcriptional regulator
MKGWAMTLRDSTRPHTIADIVEQMHQQHRELLDELRRLQAALEILDPPQPVKPKAAEDQIKDGILLNLREHGPKTEHQLARILGLSSSRARTVANKLVAGGALEVQAHGNVGHYRIKQETLRIVAGEGVR